MNTSGSPASPAISHAIELAEVSKAYGSLTALSDVTFSVASGSIHGLLGPNGAGKSTLLRLLFGLVRADAGQVTVLGGDPSRSGRPDVAGFVDAPSFYPYFSARKNLQLLSDLDGGSARDRVEESLETVGLADRARQKVGTFSTGLRQRLAIAAAFLRDPQLVILDEPTSGIDPSGVQDVHRLIERLAASGRTVLVSSHDMTEIERLCSSVTVLRRGQMLYSGTLDRLRQDAPAPSYDVQTSDNAAARALAEELPGVLVSGLEEGLVVHASPERMDDFVLALARRGTAVRSLARRDTALEALFLRLMTDETDQFVAAVDRHARLAELEPVA